MRREGIVPALIAGAAGLGSAVLGKNAQDEAAEKARKLGLESIAELDRLPYYKYIEGANPLLEMTPEDVQAQLIQEDPTLRNTEIAALQQMQQLADKGETAQDAYNYMLANQRAGTESRGQQEAIINEMQRKGAAGSGLEYALRTQAAQSAVDRFAEQQALQAAKKAELQALANVQQSNMAGDIRGEDLRAQSSNVNALNQFALENSRNRQLTAQRNIDRQNVNAQNELSQRRQVQQGNVELDRNAAQQRANLRSGQRAGELAKGISQSNLYGDIGSTIGKAAGQAYDYFTPQAELARKKAEKELSDWEG